MRHFCTADGRSTLQMRARNAFTLIEVLVALALTGLVAVIVRNVYAALGDGQSRVSAAGRTLDETANGDRLLRSLIAAAEVSEERRLIGDRDTVAFASWCMTPQGWLEVREVSVRLVESGEMKRVIVVIEGMDSVSVLSVDRNAELRYLNSLESGGQWAAGWTSRLSLPRAIGVMSLRDTVILRIGDRG